MNYDSIAKSIIASAVKTHLRTELKVHCGKVAKAKATAWLRNNRKDIDAAIQKMVEVRLVAELPTLVKSTAAKISVHAPTRRRY